MSIEECAREALKARGVSGTELNLLTELILELHQKSTEESKAQGG